MQSNTTPPRPSRRYAAITSVLIAMMAMMACIALPIRLRADQSNELATAILTYGKWYFSGKIERTFNRDGTWGSSNGTTGTWAINTGTLDIKMGGRTYLFPLPVNPNGTWGTLHGKRALLIRIGARGPKPPPPANSQPGDDATDDTEAAPTATPPISAADQQSASALIQTYHDSLVFVSGSAGSGSGFVANIGKATFLITNVHVTAGIRDAAFKTLNGTVVQGGEPSMAVGEDIFCMELPSGGKPFEIMQGVDANAAVGDEVAVLGNAEGQGVVNTIIGKIVGIGPNLVEVDAPFVPGNSGSPIIHLKSGKVIGVATYTVTNQYDLTTNQKLKKPVVRRFGYRLDSVKGWQPVNWRAFYAQAVEMEGIESLTDDLYDFFQDLNENKGVVTPGRHTNPVIKTRIDDWLAEKGTHASPEDAAQANASFLSFLKIACQSDIAAAQRQVTYDYFVRDLADQKGTRDEMAKAFQQIIQGEGQ
jgi:hypothetical protein